MVPRRTAFCVILSAAMYAPADGAALAESEDWPSVSRSDRLQSDPTAPSTAIDVFWQGAEDESKELAQAGCANLASHLLRGKGPWGLGVFKSFDCHVGEHASAGDSRAPWRLLLAWGEQELTLTVLFVAEPAAEETPVSVATLKVSRRPTTPACLAGDEIYAASLAAALLDVMPMALVREQGATAWRPSEAKDLESRALADFAPHRLQWFQLSYLADERRYWRARPAQAGSLAVAQRAEGRGQYASKLLAFAEKREEHLQRKIASADNFLYSTAKFASDSGKMLTESALANFADGYVGLRFGRELVAPGDSELPPSSLIGILGEFRTGIAKGLRIYYDLIPKSPEVVSGKELYVNWSRLVAGWGFGKSWICPLIDARCRIEGAPKLGVWSIEAQLPIKAPENKVVLARLEARRRASIGIEALGEVGFSELSARAWAASDIAVAKQPAGAVKSQRIGLDAYYKLHGLGEAMTVMLMAFVMQENISFPVEVNDDHLSPKGRVVNLGLSSTYGGGGATIAW